MSCGKVRMNGAEALVKSAQDHDVHDEPRSPRRCVLCDLCGLRVPNYLLSICVHLPKYRDKSRRKNLTVFICCKRIRVDSCNSWQTLFICVHLCSSVAKPLVPAPDRRTRGHCSMYHWPGILRFLHSFQCQHQMTTV